jgi:hypothetical protein
MSSPLKDVEVLTFDVFGTVVDWQGSGVRTLKKKAKATPGLGEISDNGA